MHDLQHIGDKQMSFNLQFVEESVRTCCESVRQTLYRYEYVTFNIQCRLAKLNAGIQTHATYL